MGGQGNARLIGWEGERTVTFTMEDALISPESFMILSGAGLIDATANNTIKQHVTEKTTAVVLAENKKSVQIYTTNLPYENISKDGKRDGEYYIYAMLVDNDEPVTEPYLPTVMRTGTKAKKFHYNEETKVYEELASDEAVTEAQNKGETIYYGLEIKAITENADNNIKAYTLADGKTDDDPHKLAKFENGVVLLDYYVEKASKAKQIEITAESFGGNFYLEASTLFRTQDGVDLPAEFIIPNCKIQSNFTFSMAATGDPSTFTFTLDAFPGTTRFNPTKKVLAAIQIIEEITDASMYRTQTIHDSKHDSYFDI